MKCNCQLVMHDSIKIFNFNCITNALRGEIYRLTKVCAIIKYKNRKLLIQVESNVNFSRKVILELINIR